MRHIAEIIDDELNLYKKNLFFYYASVQFQPLSRIFTQHSVERGGNVLDLDRDEDNNIVFWLGTGPNLMRKSAAWVTR